MGISAEHGLALWDTMLHCLGQIMRTRMLVSTSMMVFNISLMRVALPTSLCWEPVSTAEPGPRRLGPGKGVRTWVADHGRGVFDYTHIARDYVNKNGFDRH